MKLLLIAVASCLLVAPVALGQQTSEQGPRPTVKAVPRSRLFAAEQLLRDVETLSSEAMAGRKTGTAGGAKARDYVALRFRQSGLKFYTASPLQTFTFSYPKGSAEQQGANVVGYIKGKTFPASHMVVTAHYDHLGVRNGEVYNGADDNASGVAALFALGAYFSKHRPAHSIIFVAFDAEEGSGEGARKFVAEPPVNIQSIILNVNLDMISRNEHNELYAAGTYHYPFLKPYLEKVAARAPVKLLFGHDNPQLPPVQNWTAQSDHFAFHRVKIPFIYFGVEDHKDYHKATDDFENINQPFYIRAVETVLDSVKTLDDNLQAIQKQKPTLP
jgi:Zn-dependent M28 family amino/carboxypeptidase